jgi:hypothetical protein
MQYNGNKFVYPNSKLEKIGTWLIVFILFVSICILFISEPIVQDEEYHKFSDGSTKLSIPNFWNVVSNLPFAIIGIIGFWKTKPKGLPYHLFYCGVFLVSIGSGYYHWNPNNSSLVWDRLPMVIAFTSLYAIVLIEYISIKLGRILLAPLILIGLASILHWTITSDLRLYVAVQFFPLITLPILLTFWRTNKNKTGYWMLILFYIIAKLFENYDHQIHNVIGFMSGHPLKHLAAAIGIFFLLFLQEYRFKSTLPDIS